MTDLGIIIQARTNSTRFPGKILHPFYKGKSMLDVIIEKLKDLNLKIIIAIPINPSDDFLVTKYKNEIIFRGSENNVLDRFIGASQKYNLKKIIRICSDNPFLDIALLKNLINNVNTHDYISYRIDNIPAIKTHYGFFAEIVDINALKRVKYVSDNFIYNEHVTNYIYTHPNEFKIQWNSVPEIIAKNKSIRLTVDTFSDFQIAQQIYHALFPNVNYHTIIEYINNNPNISATMNFSIVQNKK